MTNIGEKLAMNGERNSETGTESQGMNQAYRDGYVLDGWYTENGIRWTEGMGTDPEYCDRKEDGTADLKEADGGYYSYYTITLTARWQLRPAEVSYELNGGSGDVRPESATVEAGGTVKVTQDIPKAPEGKVFVGWQDAQGNLWSAGESFAYGDLNAVTEIGDGAYAPDGSDGKKNKIVLSAVYADKEENAGLLLFDSMGGSAVEAVNVPIEAGKESAKAYIELSTDGKSFLVKAEEGTELAERTVPKREGYLFKGWSLEKNGSETDSVSFTRNADDTVDPVTVYRSALTRQAESRWKR